MSKVQTITPIEYKVGDVLRERWERWGSYPNCIQVVAIGYDFENYLMGKFQSGEMVDGRFVARDDREVWVSWALLDDYEPVPPA